MPRKIFTVFKIEPSDPRNSIIMVLLNPVIRCFATGKLTASLLCNFKTIIQMQNTENGTTANNSSWVQTVKNKQQEQAIIGIIQDAIIWNRIAGKMHDIINAFEPLENEHGFNPEYSYSGYMNALHVMGLIHDDNICGQLSDIFWELSAVGVNKNNKADELSQTIYIEWLVCIKNYCATIKTVA